MPHDPDRLDQRDPRLARGVALAAGALLRRWHRAEVRGLDRLPDGAALLVGNHNGGTVSPDTWIAMGALVRERGVDHLPYALGHDLVMRPPLLGPLLARLGGVRASPRNARRVLAAGHKLLVYPGGEHEALRPWRDRDRLAFAGRRGYVRLALEAGVPVVPLVAAGAHEGFVVLHTLPWLARLLRADRWARFEVWPAVLSLPWGLTFGPVPPYVPWPVRILVEVLDPVRFEREGPEAAADEAWVEACARRVEDAMQAALTRLADERRSRPR